jgi:glycosyltransferase involved in cell wall biosynthesis
MREGEQGSRSMQVLIAALNEEEGIGLTIAELRKHFPSAEVLVVDGGSRDRTVEVAKQMGATVVLQDGTGKGDAIAKVLTCTDWANEYIVVIDADYTYPAEYLPEMIRILEEQPDVGMVIGNRFNGHVDKKALHNVYYFGNRFIAFSHNLLNGVPLRDPLSGFRVIRAEILRDWQVKSKGFDVEVELNHHVERKGFRIAEVPIQYRQRVGEKKLKLVDGATILKRILLETAI